MGSVTHLLAAVAVVAVNNDGCSESDGNNYGDTTNDFRKVAATINTRTAARRSSMLIGILCLLVGLSNIYGLLNFIKTETMIMNFASTEEVRMQQHQPKDVPPFKSKSSAATKKVIKLKAYGNHTRVPNPQKRVGPNGEPGYVHDPEYIKKHPRPMQVSAKICQKPGDGEEGPAGAEALARIRNHIMEAKMKEASLVQQQQQQQQQNGKNNKKDVKVFCAIYTYQGGSNWTDAIWETWGKRCDGILFASTISDDAHAHVHIPHISKHKGKYKGIWQKVRSMHAYIYDNFLDDEYDFFHFCGDDTYLIMGNLKEFLRSDHVQTYMKNNNDLLYSGFWIHKDIRQQQHKFSFQLENATTTAASVKVNDFFYMGGGSGYTMSKAVIKDFVEKALDHCKVHAENAEEDVFTAFCLRKFLNITIGIDTRDESGAHRYHQLPVQRHANFPDIQQYGYSTVFIKEALEKMNEHYGFPIVYMQDYISNSSIAFHKYYYPKSLRRLEYLLYGTGEEECKSIQSTSAL